jgi:hypothetical protein
MPGRGTPESRTKGIWSEDELGLAIGSGLGQMVDELVLPEGLEPLQCEGGPGAIAQQALQPRAVLGLDAHRAIEGEAPTALL